MSALDIQVDGGHYKNRKLQPIELAYMLGETPAFTKLAKYLTRDKNDKMINIDKAIHCIALEKELSKHTWKYLFALFNRYVWKITNKHWTVHNLIAEYDSNVYIQGALHQMFLKDYDKAIRYVEKYRQWWVKEQEDNQ